jgi:hypothetical protein
MAQKRLANLRPLEMPMLDHTPDIETLTSEELLSIVLSTVAPSESDPLHEHGLRFHAQRAATELYCRAASAQRTDGTASAAPPRRITMVAKVSPA